jgi:hypothetical protein
MSGEQLMTPEEQGQRARAGRAAYPGGDPRGADLGVWALRRPSLGRDGPAPGVRPLR